jgi:hypothetical protein
MNTKQLKTMIRDYLDKSPARNLDIMAAIEERLQHAGDTHAQGQGKRDALDQWLAECLAGPASGNPKDLEAKIAKFLDGLTPSPSAADQSSDRIAAYRTPLNHIPDEASIPFSEDEIRSQVQKAFKRIKSGS